MAHKEDRKKYLCNRLYYYRNEPTKLSGYQIRSKRKNSVDLFCRLGKDALFKKKIDSYRKYHSLPQFSQDTS